MGDERLHQCCRRTPLGLVRVVWSSRGGRTAVDRVVIRARGSGETAGPPCAEIALLADRIAAFLAGEDVEFALDAVRLEACPPFQRAALRAAHGIPRGSVAAYGRIAAMLGRPGAARAVGRAMAANPFPVIVPCHRVVRSDGLPGGYGGGAAMKRALLAMEGVRLDGRGRVVPRARGR